MARALLSLSLLLSCSAAGVPAAADNRPNILFALADDWSWPHSDLVGEPVIHTPTFDRIAREGVLFQNAFVTSPTCSASRAGIVTGQWPWRLAEGCNLFGTLPARFPVYPDLLEKAGYYVGYSVKGWGPGNETASGRTRNAAGRRYKDFAEFLKNRPAGRPFCFWFGSHDPHRPYKWQSGLKSGLNPAAVRVPACLPDTPETRLDMCDYFFAVQRFDRELGDIVSKIEQQGELDRTLIAVSGDNGLPFPRCKANLYDGGTHVPLAVRWGRHTMGPRVVEDFVSLADLAPTFLVAAGLKPPAEMTGRSLLDVLTSERSGQVDPRRDHVLTCMERHSWGRAGGLGYPMRAIRTKDFLYIRNFEPDRWPAGDPQISEGWPQQVYSDIDASPTKDVLLKRRDEPAIHQLFELACGKRPGEELYDLRRDPDELKNVAGEPGYSDAQRKLSAALMAELVATKDPRALGQGDRFDKYPFYGPKTIQRSHASPPRN